MNPSWLNWLPLPTPNFLTYTMLIPTFLWLSYFLQFLLFSKKKKNNNNNNIKFFFAFQNNESKIILFWQKMKLFCFKSVISMIWDIFFMYITCHWDKNWWFWKLVSQFIVILMILGNFEAAPGGLCNSGGWSRASKNVDEELCFSK